MPRRKKIRIVFCGNFEPKKSGEKYYTANVEIPSIRLLLHEAAQHESWGISSFVIEAAFLNADMPGERLEDAVYVKPPKILVDFGITDKYEVWRLEKALYGLRVSPRLWRKERDRQLAALRFELDGVMYKLSRSNIDPSLWTVHEDNGCEFLHQIVPASYLVVCR